MSSINKPPAVPKLDAPNIDPLHGTKYDFPRDLKGYGRESLDPKWPNGAKVAVSFVINYEGKSIYQWMFRTFESISLTINIQRYMEQGAERTVTNGDEQSESHLWEQSNIGARLGERALNCESDYDYGSRVGVWRLLDLFESYKFPVTVYAVGQAFEKNLAVAKAFTRNGHEVASHAYRWVDYHGMTAEQEKEFIVRQIVSLQQTTGSVPVGWYYGRLSPRSKALVHEVFEEMGHDLLYESDAYNDDLPHWVDVPAEKGSQKPKGMLMIPYTYDCNDLKFHSPQGWGSPGAFEEHLKNAFDTLYAEGVRGRPKMMTVGLHCRITGKPGRFQALKHFVEYIASKTGVWVVTRRDIALHFREKFPYRRG